MAQEGDLYRLPDLDDEAECAAARRLVRRVHHRVARIDELRSLRSDEADICREIEQLEGVVATFRALVPIDRDGRVATVVRALGPDWEVTDPNRPAPYIRRYRPHIPGPPNPYGHLGDVVLAHRLRSDGFPRSLASLVEAVLDQECGRDAELRGLLRPVVTSLARELRG